VLILLPLASLLLKITLQKLSAMEPEVAAFLRKIGKSILATFIWLALTAIAAIKGDNAFIGEHIQLNNVLFYIWLIISVVLLVKVYKKVWVAKT